MTHVWAGPIQDAWAIIHFILLAGNVICWPGSHPLSAGSENNSLECNLGCKAPLHPLHFLSVLASWLNVLDIVWNLLQRQNALEPISWLSQVSGHWTFEGRSLIAEFKRKFVGVIVWNLLMHNSIYLLPCVASH